MESNHILGRIYKLDNFAVPSSARSEFLPIVLRIMDLLKAQPGHIQSFILEQQLTASDFNLATLVEWKNKQAAENARNAVVAMQEESGLNPQEMMAKLGIRAEMGFYNPVNA